MKRHYFSPRYTCAAFDPTPWVALAQAQLPLRPQVAEALVRCTRHWSGSELFSYFQDPDAPDRKPRARIFFLHCPRNGRLIFDADAHAAIRGVEYVDLTLPWGPGSKGKGSCAVGLGRGLHNGPPPLPPTLGVFLPR